MSTTKLHPIFDTIVTQFRESYLAYRAAEPAQLKLVQGGQLTYHGALGFDEKGTLLVLKTDSDDIPICDVEQIPKVIEWLQHVAVSSAPTKETP